MINKVTLIGNLGRDPEVRHLESGAVVARLAIATNENYRDREGNWQTQTEWHNVNVWGNQAETAEKYLRKGSLVYIEGKLTTRKWQDKDGNDRYTTEVRGQIMRMLDRRENSTPGIPQSPMPTQAPQQTMSSTPASPQAPSSTGVPSTEDDLPF